MGVAISEPSNLQLPTGDVHVHMCYWQNPLVSLGEWNLPLTQTQELGSLGFILKLSQCISFLNLANDS